MDVFNTISAQLRDLFQSMTAGARITAGLLLVVAVASIGLLFRQGAAAPDDYLFGGERFSMTQIGRMEAAAAEGGLSLASWEVDSNRIRVPRGQKDAYVAAIASGGAMPKDFTGLMEDALDKATGWETRQQWELRTKSARESQFSHLISMMPWVEQAKVMFDIEDRRGVGRKNQASASVFVVPRPGEAVDKMRSRRLQEFVAGGLTSLAAADVHITSGGDEAYSSDDIMFDDPYLRARDELQRSYRQMILQGLSYIPGVRVEVSGDVDNLARSTKVESSPGETAVVREVTDDETVSTTVADGGGRPGAVANGADRTGRDESLARENRSETTHNVSNVESTVGVTTSHEEYQGFKPKEMYASIAVPRDYIIKIWNQKNPDATPEDLTATVLTDLEGRLRTDVENYVENILPRLALGQDKYEQVEVVFYDSEERALPAEPTLAANAMTWAGHYWSTLSMIGLAVFSLLMLRSVVRPGKTPDRNANDVTLKVEMGTSHAAETDDEEELERPKLKLRKGDSLKDDLSEMVRENPDGAAAILRTWIGNAG